MQKYTAIILGSWDSNEFDRVYTMYTLEQGLVRAVAKGARKLAAKLAGHLEPGTLSEVYVAKSRGMGQITGAITLETYENIRNIFEKLAETLEIFRFFLKNFGEGEKDKYIFELLRDFLSLASQTKTNQSLALGTEAFWWKLFDALGNRPEVIKCISCKEKLAEGSRKFLKIEKGGIICSNCSPKFKNMLPISNNQIKLLRIFWGNSFEKIVKVKVGKIELEKLAKIREAYAKYHFA